MSPVIQRGIMERAARKGGMPSVFPFGENKRRGEGAVGEVILTMREIDKTYPGVHALDHVNFDVRRGEVHALVGENGAGKSTLMKVMTGIVHKDSGTITFEGREVNFHSAREAQAAGIVIVHQELNMMGPFDRRAKHLYWPRIYAGAFLLTIKK